jgi:hypothetical protein
MMHQIWDISGMNEAARVVEEGDTEEFTWIMAFVGREVWIFRIVRALH